MSRRTKPPRNTSFKEITAAFMKRSGRMRRIIPIDLVLLFLDGFMQAVVPAFMGYIVDQLIKDAGGFVRHQLPWMAAAVVAGSIVFYLVAFTQHYLTQKIGRCVGVNFQVELYGHLQQLSADFYQRHHVGEITSRLTKDITVGVEPMFPLFTAMFWALSVLVPSCISMIYLSGKLFFVFFVISVVFAALSKMITPTVRALSREVQDEAGRVSARLTEAVSANSLIRAFAQEESFYSDVSQHVEMYLTKVLRSLRLTTLFYDLLNAFLSIFAPLAVLLAGAYFVRDGVTIGTLVAAYGYWKAAAGPITIILNNMTVLFTALASMDRILEFFKETPSVKDKPGAPALKLTKGEIEFKDVFFRYPVNEGDFVLNGLNLRALANRSLAIVGESGAGKSTIVQLLMRFYDPTKGQVLVDNKDIRDVAQASLRQQIGLVMQDTILLSGTIRENMLFANPEAGEPQIVEALRRARAWDFVKEMPDGLDTILGERGARLSGGQRQRMSIARVFLKNPPIVVFDEATSSLDTITEKQIQETMKPLFEGRTSIVIAHRLSTIWDCDQIAVIDKGRVSAQGAHAELLETSTQYREMCRRQAVGD